MVAIRTAISELEEILRALVTAHIAVSEALEASCAETTDRSVGAPKTTELPADEKELLSQTKANEKKWAAFMGFATSDAVHSR